MCLLKHPLSLAYIKRKLCHVGYSCLFLYVRQCANVCIIAHTEITLRVGENHTVTWNYTRGLPVWNNCIRNEKYSQEKVRELRGGHKEKETLSIDGSEQTCCISSTLACKPPIYIFGYTYEYMYRYKCACVCVCGIIDLCQWSMGIACCFFSIDVCIYIYMNFVHKYICIYIWILLAIDICT